MEDPFRRRRRESLHRHGQPRGPHAPAGRGPRARGQAPGLHGERPLHQHCTQGRHCQGRADRPPGQARRTERQGRPEAHCRHRHRRAGRAPRGCSRERTGLALRHGDRCGRPIRTADTRRLHGSAAQLRGHEDQEDAGGPPRDQQLRALRRQDHARRGARHRLPDHLQGARHGLLCQAHGQRPGDQAHELHHLAARGPGGGLHRRHHTRPVHHVRRESSALCHRRFPRREPDHGLAGLRIDPAARPQYGRHRGHYHPQRCRRGQHLRRACGQRRDCDHHQARLAQRAAGGGLQRLAGLEALRALHGQPGLERRHGGAGARVGRGQHLAARRRRPGLRPDGTGREPLSQRRHTRHTEPLRRQHHRSRDECHARQAGHARIQLLRPGGPPRQTRRAAAAIQPEPGQDHGRQPV